VNPDGLDNQVSGSAVQGLGGALFEAIAYEDGRLTNGHFENYRVPRFSDVPAIDVVLLDRRDIRPAGAGETPIVGVAPAIGNAIFHATGQRLRSMPMVPGGLPASTDQA
jgi:isoquinoline 1-oxidoreductase